MYTFNFWCFIISVLLWKAMKNKLQSQLTTTGSEGFESICVKDCITKHILWKRAAYRPLLYCMIFFFSLIQIVWLEAASYPLPTPAPHPGFSGPLAQGALGHGLAGLLIFGWGEVHAGWWGMCTFGLRAWDSAALGQNKCPRRTSVCHSASLCDRNGTAKA